jgi:hypothetical protein
MGAPQCIGVERSEGREPPCETRGEQNEHSTLDAGGSGGPGGGSPPGNEGSWGRRERAEMNRESKHRIATMQANAQLGPTLECDREI